LMTYWYTGALREHSSSRAADLLVWSAIESGHAMGQRTMDFGGAGRPDEAYGVRDFKAKYGGELVEHGRDVLVPSPLRLRVANGVYRRARRFL
jgi:serine/alanine adding enzyme